VAGHGQVRLTISVKIGRDQGVDSESAFVVNVGLERTIAVAIEDRDTTVNVEVRSQRQIQLAVSAKIGRYYGDRIWAALVVNLVSKGAIASVEQDGNQPWPETVERRTSVGDGEVWLA